MTLYVLSYNNYFNRKVMVLSDIAACEPYVKQKIEHVSFNPNDGVTTSQIVNSYSEGDYLVCSEDDKTIESRWFILEADRTRQGQYNLQLKRDSIADNLEAVKSAPLFVEKAMLEDDDPMIVNDEGMQTNKVKTREILLKDSSEVPWIVGYVAKNWDTSATTPAKGSIDASYTPETTIADAITLGDVADGLGISESLLASCIGIDGQVATPLKVTDEFRFRYGTGVGISLYNTKFTFGSRCDVIEAKSYLDNEFYQKLIFNIDLSTGSSVDTIRNALRSAFATKRAALVNQMDLNTGYGYYIPYYGFQTAVSKLEGKRVYYLGNYYKIRFVNNGKQEVEQVGPKGYKSFFAFCDIIDDVAWPTDVEKRESGQAALQFYNYDYLVYLDTDADYSTEITLTSARKTLTKEAFDMFCMPAEDLQIEGEDGETYLSNGNICRNMANAIRTKLNANCYDLQLLPYCPLGDRMNGTGQFSLTNMTEGQDYSWIKPSTTQSKTKENYVGSSYTVWKKESVGGNVYKISAYYNAPIGASNPTFSYIDQSLTVNTHYISKFTVSGPEFKNPTSYDVQLIFMVSGGDETATDAFLKNNGFTFGIKTAYTVERCGILFWTTDNSFNVDIDRTIGLTHSMKAESNCCSWRLCSPNYQGSFEFNVAKNGGKVKGFRADCTYKPYNPYIRVYPNFSWLYGSDFGDGRGLICGGDFSLPQVTDAWASYQLQNKNYQNTFNREIQSLDYSNKLQMRNQIVGMFSGAIGDATRGVGSGKAFGLGGVGAGVMGAIAGAASLAGGIADTVTLAQQQKESRQLSIDKFSYQLGNIQALPYTISKVGTFDINSKVFPFLEFYDCTDQELEAFENKIKYESMTVMRIGTLEEFKKTDMSYIKGSLIRLDGIGGDTRLLNDIYSELYKGVFY